MEWMRALGVLCALTVVMARPVVAAPPGNYGPASSTGLARVMSLDPIVEVPVDGVAGRRMLCETRNRSPASADPVLHAMAIGAPQELRHNDDGAGNLNARLVVPMPQGGRFLLVLRAAGPGRGGTADIYCDGRLLLPRTPFGGQFAHFTNIRSQERLVSVPLPDGPSTHTVYVLDATGRIVARHAPVEPPHGRSPESVRIDLAPQNELIVMVGYPWPGTRLPQAPNRIRLVRNDALVAGHDADLDGLGREVERSVLTCATRSDVVGNWECARTADARDTDGDGLPDGLELLGRFDGQIRLLLPRWGADPRHKDVFVEVDYRAPTDNDHQSAYKLSRDVALQMAAMYAGTETDPLRNLAIAQSLNNPDLKPGISLHLDTGLAPAADAEREELSTYGDWGGAESIASPCESVGVCKGPPWFGDVRTDRMASERRGIFHYALAEASGGGQAPLRSIGLNLPKTSAVTAAHEFGHTLGLHHYGPARNPDEPNCKPNYPSLMNYAYAGRAPFTDGFSDGVGRPSLNNLALAERGAVSAPTSEDGVEYLDHLQKIFLYSVDRATGDVDWNRDGVISSDPVRAFAGNYKGGSCEAAGANRIATPGLSDWSPSLTRLGTVMHLFYVDERDRKLHLETTQDSLVCPVAAEGCGPAWQSVSITQAWNHDILGFDAHPVTYGGIDRLLLVVNTSQGLFETLGSGNDWTPPRHIRSSRDPGTEFSLADSDNGTWLAFKSLDGYPVLMHRWPSGFWGPEERAYEWFGQDDLRLAPDASPGIVRMPLADGRTAIAGAFPLGPDGRMSTFLRDPANGRWIAVTSNQSMGLIGRKWAESATEAVGRPALAVERLPDPATPGAPRIPVRLHIAYLARSSEGRYVARRRVLEVSGGLDPAEQTLELVDSDLTNGWLYGLGVDLLYEGCAGCNVRLALSSALVEDEVPQPHHVWVFPKADGILDLTYQNRNDWEAMGIDVCHRLKDDGAQVQCHPWPY